MYEEIEYTGISGNELTGVTRGMNGFSAKPHSNGATIVSVVSSIHNNRVADKLRSVDATLSQDPNNNEIIKTSYNASAVNEVTVTNAATGNSPSISATGGDTNIGLILAPKGTGVVATQGAENYAADAGSNDTYAITVTGITAYATGQVFKFKANTANTGAATLNVNSLGAKTIVKNYNATLADNDILANQLVEVIYDGTNFQLLSPISNAGSTGKVLQVANYSDTTAITTSSTSLVDMTNVTLTITTALNSKILVLFTVQASHNTTAASRVQVAPMLDGGSAFSTYSAFGRSDAGGNAGTVNLNYMTAAQTAGSHTVKIQWASTDTGQVNAVYKSLTIMEIAA